MSVAQTMGREYMQQNGYLTEIPAEKLADVGRDIAESAMLTEKFTKALSVIMARRESYVDEFKPLYGDIMVTREEWGGYIERDYIDFADIMDDPVMNLEDGKDYFFTTREDFDNIISQNGFLEYSNHFDNFYGTPKQFVKDKLEFGDVLLEIDVNGGLQVKNNFPDAVLIMLLPPNKEELVRRLVERNTETEDKIKARLLRLDYEMEMERLYDYSVVNDDLETAVTEIESIIEKEKNR